MVKTMKLYASLVAVIVVLVLCIGYILGGVLDTPVTRASRMVTVDLPATGGLYVGSSVTYRGVAVGKVTAIDLSGDAVTARVRLTGSEQIPIDSRAQVRSLSPVGEQYLDFQPRGDHGPYLHDGSRVQAGVTDIPQTLGTTVLAITKLMDQVDDRQVRQVLQAVSVGLDGTGPALRQMIDQAQVILNDLRRRWPQTERLLRNSGTVLDIGTRNSRSIERLARNSREFAAFLKDYQPELERSLRAAPGQERALQAVVDDIAEALPPFLAAAIRVGNLLASYDPHLRELLARYSPGLGVLGEVISGRSLQISLVNQDDARCNYGTTRTDPTSTAHPRLQTGGHCPGSFPRLQRGAAHAPGPVRR